MIVPAETGPEETVLEQWTEVLTAEATMHLETLLADVL